MSDHAAAQVERISTAPVKSGVLQRACACGQHTHAGGECASCKKKRPGLQRAATNREDLENSLSVPPSVSDVLRLPGQPLDQDTRHYMEPRFGYDFSQVRVHTDSKAAESAVKVNALAYTVGNDIAFGAGQYSPRTRAGKRLLAHELAHVVQQQSVDAGSTLVAQQFSIQENTAPLESEADRAAEQVAAGSRAQVYSALSATGVQRQDAGAAPGTGQVCGGYEDFLKSWFIDPNVILDGATCLCFGAGLIDLIPIQGVGSNPAVEWVDCACNIFTVLQEIYNRGSDGGCWSIANLANPTDHAALTVLANLTAIDCTSAPLGTILGGMIGGLLGIGGGTAGGPPGEAGGGILGAISGAAIGDFIVDVGAMAFQNMITQHGTPWPKAQMAACSRFYYFFKSEKFGQPLTPEEELFAGGFESEL